MTRPIKPELFAERPVRSDFGRGPRGPRLRIGRFLALLAFVALIGMIIWGVSFYMGDDESANGALPYVEADLPLKERPENPGGIDIPHQDIQVFQQLANKTPPVGTTPEVEHLLPAPETPQPALVAPTEELPASAPAVQAEEELPPAVTEAEPPAVQTVQPAPEPQAAPVPSPSEGKTVTVKVEPAPEKTVKVEPAPEPAKTAPPAVKKQEVAPKKEVKPKAPDKVDQALARLPKELFTTGTVPAATVATKTPSGDKTVRVQLASFPEEAAAQQALGRYQSQYGAAVGASLSVVRAQISGKGTFYRIMSDPLSSAQAKSACAALAKKSAACIVVR